MLNSVLCLLIIDFLEGEDESVTNKKLPNGWISDSENKMFGYCPGYELREIITEQVCDGCHSLEDVMRKWEDKLYIVGSIDLRQSALFGDENPQNFRLSDFRYIFLELIGKTRENGLRQCDFCNYSMDPRSSFHFIKALLDLGLVTKQKFCFIKEVTKCGHPKWIRTNILFLKRFHRTLVSYQSELEEKVLAVLAAAPGQMLEIGELRHKLDCSKKVLQMIRKSLYENGNIQYIKDGKLYNKQNNLLPKSTTFYVQYVKPFTQASQADEDYDDVDEESLYVSKCKYKMPQLLLGIPKIQQLYWLLDSSKEEGMTIGSFGIYACLPFRTARSVIRHFRSRELVKGVAIDSAKQKVVRFHSMRYLYDSKAFKEINAEFDRAMDLGQDERIEQPVNGAEDSNELEGISR